MRAREFLFEDDRSKIQKLEELIAHPGTEDTIRAVALSKLETLRANLVVEPRKRINVPVNLEESDLDTHFLPGVTLGQLYDGLCGLQPAPNNIHFYRQGQIQMMVPPPFMNKTKQQYLSEINAVCRGARAIHGTMIEGSGYRFVITYV